MAIVCNNCQSRFMKTLEIRIRPQPDALQGTCIVYFKKRCKRCKYKLFYGQELPEKSTYAIHYEDWLAGVKIQLPQGSEQRTRLTVSEYTRRISQPADSTFAYLDRIESLEGAENAAKGVS